jgi:integrase
MARRATGTILEHPARDGRIYRSLRFSAYGRRRHISLGPITRAEAERELRHVLADVERGTWRPAQAVEPPEERKQIPDFHTFAEEWWVRIKPQIAPATQHGYLWRLERHLLPYFAEMPLDAITFDTVESYIAVKLSEDKPLSPTSINMTLTLLGAILEGAVERELIGRNPARGRRRRVRERVPRRSHLETAGQITALLEAAGELDREAQPSARHIERRAMLSVLTFAGLRIGELCSLRWRDVDLATGWLSVEDSKTDAGRRRVKIRGALGDELRAARARTPHTASDELVFPTRSARRQDPHNFRGRVLAGVIDRANQNLAAHGLAPLPKGITPHSLRRTFASVLYALGEDPGVVMDEMGHTDPGLALRVYRQAMRRGGDEKAQLRALVEGSDPEWARDDANGGAPSVLHTRRASMGDQL